ncbi:Metallo-dependent phosphatase [Ramaria rubella]|nr:Metallo-dependent phosphatase [Ramaria rubella]
MRASYAASSTSQNPISPPLDPYPNKPRIKFNPTTGTFRIMVFSDMHYGENPWDSWGPEQDKNSTILMKKVLKDENPDYVVLNGDLITGENTFAENATSLIDEIVAPLNAAKIPFSSTQGNHDNNVNITHLAEIEREQLVAPLSYTRVAPPGVGGEEGPGNYWVPVYQNDRDNEPILVLWFFDSRGGFRKNLTNLPDWVDASVADWIASETEVMDKAWGPPENRAALAFVHIPPNVVQNLSETLNNTLDPGLNADEPLSIGSTQSTFNTTLYGTGNDKPFWDSVNANIKNLHAIVSGHDHGNEWCTRDPGKNVIFCFDKHAGYGGYDSPDWGHGVRDFVFYADNITGGVDTWIRLEDGTKRAIVRLDKDFE